MKAPRQKFASPRQNPYKRELSYAMVAIAQLVEHRIVIPVVAGSSPVGHPNS